MREYVAQGKSLLWNIFRNIFRMIFTIMQSVFFKNITYDYTNSWSSFLNKMTSDSKNKFRNLLYIVFLLTLY